MSNFLLSIIVPVYNEENNISPFLERIMPIIKDYHHEIIFVNDGSQDKTFSELKKHAAKNKNIKFVSFYRNFGHQMALSCGYEHAKGDCVITLDVDLQDPPEIIPKMIDEWKKGAKIVYAKREKRETDGFLKRITAQYFYKLMSFLSDIPVPENVGDYRLLDHEVVNFIKNLKEQSRFLRGLVAWGGYPASYVYFTREKRFSGNTHYTFSKMLNFALDGITSFSTKPLRLVSYFGFLVASIGFLGIIYAVIGKIFLPSYWVTGWTALFVGIMFIGGVQLITIGIIGEYIGKIYREIQQRPKFIISEKMNL